MNSLREALDDLRHRLRVASGEYEYGSDAADLADYLMRVVELVGQIIAEQPHTQVEVRIEAFRVCDGLEFIQNEVARHINAGWRVAYEAFADNHYIVRFERPRLPF